MTAKQYLSQIPLMKRQIESLELQREYLRSKADGVAAIRYDKDKVQVSPENRFEKIMIQLSEVETRYYELILEHETEREKRIEMIKALDRPEYVEILTKRYLDPEGGKLSDVAERMNISYAWARHVHGKALQSFEKKYADALKDNTQKHISM